MPNRKPCSACKDYPQYQRDCRECHGVGFIEIDTCTAGEDWREVCPVKGDPMTGGWECEKCGGSGPW